MSREDLEVMSKEEIAKHVLRIKQDVYNRLSDFEDDIVDIKHSVNKAHNDRKEGYELQKQMQEQLNKLFELLESQSSSIKELSQRQQKSDERFEGHDDKEMEQYKLIVDAINNLEKTIQTVAEDTEYNTSFIGKLKKYWFAITISSMTIVTIVGGLWWLIVELEARGLLILFPTGE